MYLHLLTNTISQSLTPQPKPTPVFASLARGNNSTTSPLARMYGGSLQGETVQETADYNAVFGRAEWKPVSCGDIVVYVRRLRML